MILQKSKVYVYDSSGVEGLRGCEPYAKIIIIYIIYVFKNMMQQKKVDLDHIV